MAPFSAIVIVIVSDQGGGLPRAIVIVIVSDQGGGLPRAIVIVIVSDQGGGLPRAIVIVIVSDQGGGLPRVCTACEVVLVFARCTPVPRRQWERQGGLHPTSRSRFFFFFFWLLFPSYISGVHHFGVRFLRMCRSR